MSLSDRLIQCQTYIHNVCAGCLGRTKPNDIEDAVQEVNLKVLRTKAVFLGNADFRTWLHSICVNTCRMEFRKDFSRKRFAKTVSLDVPIEDDSEIRLRDLLPSLPDNTASRILIKEIVRTLPSSYHKIFIAVMVKGMSCEEAAKVVGKSPLAIKTTCSRIRLVVRSQFSDRAYDQGRRNLPLTFDYKVD
jgi:RNA polymerase sigma factor (sigma-70 family)